MLSIFLFLFSAFCSQPRNLVTNGDFSAYPITSPYLTATDPYNYTYKFFHPDGIWYSNDTYYNSFQVRTVQGYQSLFLDTIGSQGSTKICQQVSLPMDGLFTLNFTYLIDQNLIQAKLQVLWNAGSVYKMIAVNYFAEEQSIRVDGSMGTSTLCFVGSDQVLKPGIPSNPLGVLVTGIKLFAPSTINVEFQIEGNKSFLALKSNYRMVDEGQKSLIENFTIILIDNVSCKVSKVSSDKEDNFILHPEVQSYNEQNIEIILPDNLIMDENSLPIQFTTQIVQTPLPEKEVFFSTMKGIFKQVGYYAKISTSFFVIIGFTYFILRFFSFINLICMYYYLNLASPLEQYFTIFGTFVSNLSNEGIINFLINLLYKGTVNFNFVESIPERVPKMGIGRSWFRESNISSIFVNNNIEELLIFILALVKIFILYSVLNFIKSRKQKNQQEKKQEQRQEQKQEQKQREKGENGEEQKSQQVKKSSGYWIKIITIQLLSITPVVILPFTIEFSSSASFQSSNFFEKMNHGANIMIPFFFLLLPFIIYLRQNQKTKKTKKNKEKVTKNKKKIKEVKKLSPQEQKYQYKKAISKIKFFDNCMFFILPFFAGINNNSLFFTIVSPIIYIRLILVLQSCGKLRKVQFFVHCIEKIIWVLFHSIQLFFHLHELSAKNDVDTQVIVLLCKSALLLILIGVIFQFSVGFLSLFYKIFRQIRKKCKKNNKVAIENTNVNNQTKNALKENEKREIKSCNKQSTEKRQKSNKKTEKVIKNTRCQMLIEKISEDEKKNYQSANQYFSSVPFQKKKNQNKENMIKQHGSKAMGIYFWKQDRK